jgi:hypothetical protein
MPALDTWAGRSTFDLTGNLATGTTITYGKGWTVQVSAAQYAALLAAFPAGTIVDAGTSRTNPPIGSLGAWLQVHISKTATASYIGPILLHFGHAQRVPGNPTEIEFL